MYFSTRIIGEADLYANTKMFKKLGNFKKMEWNKWENVQFDEILGGVAITAALKSENIMSYLLKYSQVFVWSSRVKTIKYYSGKCFQTRPQLQINNPDLKEGNRYIHKQKPKIDFHTSDWRVSTS